MTYPFFSFYDLKKTVFYYYFFLKMLQLEIFYCYNLKVLLYCHNLKILVLYMAFIKFSQIQIIHERNVENIFKFDVNY